MFRILLLFTYILLCFNCAVSITPLKSDLLPDKGICGLRVGVPQQYNKTDDTDINNAVRVIFNGKITKVGEFPWLVLLVSSDGEMDCGGALINNRYVLTAAHCVDDPEYPIVKVRLGEYDIKEDPDCNRGRCGDPVLNLEVEDTIIHENHAPNDDNMYNDIALIRLKENVVFTDFIRPICLPLLPELKNETSGIGSVVSVAGWGRTERKSRSNLLLHARVPIVSNTDCNQLYKTSGFSITKSQICAGGVNGKDSCQGDSGGPLMYLHSAGNEMYWYSIGIVSYGLGCGVEGAPGVYTRVVEYLEWIINNLKL